MKIAILTDFRSWDDAYSVATVVKRQRDMLRRKGHEVSLVVRSDFLEAQVPLDSRCVIALPQFFLNPSEDPPNDFVNLVNALVDDEIGYRTLLCGGYEVVITHDLMTSAWALTNCVAIHNVAKEFPAIKWIHWCHSQPEPVPDIACFPSTMRWVAAPNSVYVLPSQPTAVVTDRVRGSVAATVFNPCDPRDFFDFGPLSWSLCSKYKLLDHDYLQVYPFSQERWQSKGVRHLLRFFGKLKAHGNRVKLVLANAHTESSVGRSDMRRMKDYAVKSGLRIGEDVIIMAEAGTELGENWKQATPWKIVRNLMSISNVFVFPSGAECCSLIQAEASVAGACLVLNSSLSESLNLADDNQITFDFSAHDPDYDDFFYEQITKKFWEWHTEQATLRTTRLARTKYYNEDWIYENQLKPLLEGAA